MKYENTKNVDAAVRNGSWMPVDVESHWRWNNPLNALVALPMVMIVLSFILSLLLGV